MSSPAVLTPMRRASSPISTDVAGYEDSDDATYSDLGTGIPLLYVDPDLYERPDVENTQRVAGVTGSMRAFKDRIIANKQEDREEVYYLWTGTPLSYGEPDGYGRRGVQSTLTRASAMKPATTKASTSDRAGLVALLPAHETAFVERVIANLEEDREEALSEGEAVATDAAENACVEVARTIASCLPPFVQGLKWAAFAGDSGVVSLILQSSVSDRRLEYEFSPDGKKVAVVEIDEHLEHKLTKVGIEDAQFLRERAGWIARRT